MLANFSHYFIIDLDEFSILLKQIILIIINQLNAQGSITLGTVNIISTVMQFFIQTNSRSYLIIITIRKL